MVVHRHRCSACCSRSPARPAAYTTAPTVLALPLDEGVDVVGTVGFVFAAGRALAAGLGFVLRSTAGALVSVFLLMLVLPLLLPAFGYEWMTDARRAPAGLRSDLPPHRGADEDRMTETLLGHRPCSPGRVGSLLLGWLRLVRDDANR